MLCEERTREEGGGIVEGGRGSQAVRQTNKFRKQNHANASRGKNTKATISRRGSSESSGDPFSCWLSGVAGPASPQTSSGGAAAPSAGSADEPDEAGGLDGAPGLRSADLGLTEAPGAAQSAEGLGSAVMDRPA